MCTLRAWGKYFDVDRFVAGSRWKVSRVYHRGSKDFKKKSLYSGFNLGISNASLKSVKAQAADAVKWLQRNGPELRRLRRSSGVQGITLDFPVNSRLGKKIAVQCDRFPSDLIAAAGRFGLEIELSIYG